MRPLALFLRVLAGVLLGEVAVLGPTVLGAACVVGVLHDPKVDRVRGIDLPALRQALNLYRAKVGRLPEQLEELLVGGYLEQLPTDPWDRDYRYQRLDGGACVGSLGKDGSPGGEGQDADLWSGVAASPSEPAPPCGAPP